jgi:hypothetical protein
MACHRGINRESDLMRHAHPAIAAIGAALACFVSTGTARAAVDFGTLACNVGGGPGLVIGSLRPLACTYNGPTGPEHYIGSVTKFGMDIGYLNGGEIVWNVMAPNTAPVAAHGMLSGNYAGVTGSAAVGVGAGANVLVGGSGQSFTLQPVSVEGQTGVDIAAGVESMSLQSQP